jgi:hypothetical protein
VRAGSFMIMQPVEEMSVSVKTSITEPERQPTRVARKDKPPLLDQLDHEVSRLLVILNIWHDEIPPILREELRKGLISMGRMSRSVRATILRMSKENIH